MPTVSSVPSATRTGQWSTTPAQSAANHHLNVDEAWSPGDTADYVNVAGFTGGFVDEYDFPDDTTNLDTILEVRVQVRINGSAITNNPALKVQLWVGNVLYGGNSIYAVLTSGWEEKTFSFTGIPANAWQVGPRTVKFVPVDGASYGDAKDFESF